jgi:quercetin dioxygenase-like cupin family protein
MKINRGRVEGKPSEAREENFTGAVWADPVLAATDGVMINNVFFEPGSRTYWHSHDGGQVLHVLAGQGRVCLRGGEPETIGAGDIVFFEPGEEHWHGADEAQYLLHLAISLGGHAWLEPVTDEEYAGRSDR